jgi:hypothetical protein
MPRILRVNDPHGEPMGTAESRERLQRVIEGLGPGRYRPVSSNGTENRRKGRQAVRSEGAEE